MSRSSSNHGRHLSPSRTMRKVPARVLNQKYSAEVAMRHLPIVIVIAPQGTGKTRNAAALAARFGCNCIVDEWDGVSELQPGTLALTNMGLPVESQPAREVA